MDKPRVLVCVLVSSERHGWVNPRLCEALIHFSKDERFDVTVEMVSERWVDHARNVAVVAAREHGATWLIQIDNDCIPPSNLIGILSDADASGKQIVGLGSAVFSQGEPQIIPGDNGRKDGAFRQTGNCGAGVLLMHSKVWETIPGPWFKWVSNDDETTTLRLGEDYYFTERAIEHGFTIWTHRDLAGHLRSLDICALAIKKELSRPAADRCHAVKAMFQ